MVAPIADKTITQQVQSKLTSRGIGASCRVAVATNRGDVTLTGTVQYAHQKAAAVQTATGVSGVRRVIDQLTVKAVPKR